MNSAEKALYLHRKGCNSAQAILAAFSKEIEISDETARKMAAGFGAGIGTMQKTCGALTGAVMVLGCRYHSDENLYESKQLLFEKTQALLQKFRTLHGTLDCRELIGVDFYKPGGMQKVRQQRLFENRCQQYIREVCRFLEEDS